MLPLEWHRPGKSVVYRIMGHNPAARLIISQLLFCILCASFCYKLAAHKKKMFGVSCWHNDCCATTLATMFLLGLTIMGRDLAGEEVFVLTSPMKRAISNR